MRDKVKKIQLLLVVLALCGNTIHARTIRGTVSFLNSKGKKEALVGANVFLSDTRKGVIADMNGLFRVEADNEDAFLVASFTGFLPDSIRVSSIHSGTADFLLSEGVELEEAVVTANRQGTVFSRLSLQKTELITSTGLMKMACCNLSESFENSATITVGYTDAVSGAKQVQLLGLSGIYCQMMDENVPTLRGLASTYGWSYTPGPWLESVQISKGASSVVNGYESVTGQINVEHRKPNNTNPLFINLFVDDAKRTEANVTAATKINDKWSVGLLAHGSRENEVHDDNGDTFMDMPKTELVNLYNRWFYLDGEKGIQSRFGLKFLYETRTGGQDSVCHDANGARLYETHIKNRNITAYNKTGIAIGDKEGQSIGIINSYTFHEQNSVFGLKSFNGVQNSFYSNWLFTSYIGNPSHKYTAGVSFIYDNYKTNYVDSLPYNKTPLTKLNRNEAIPGAFVEYTYLHGDKLTLVLGARADYSDRYGWLLTPRGNLRYNINENIIFRMSAGRGYRTANVLAENIGLLASSRKFDVESINTLDIEKAWNYGANLTFYIPLWDERKATLSVDYFRTDFQGQAVVDMERDRHAVFFYNLSGHSYANAFQVDLSATLFKGFDLYAAFRINDTWITYSEEGKEYAMEKPLTSHYRGLLNLAYATNLRKWVFDVTAQLNGPARIPGMNGYASQKRESESFPVCFAQVTRNTKRFDVYLGAENIANYKQKDPIIDPQNPFLNEFDSSMIWGPLMGRKIYCGIRWRIGKL